ncbi:MAG: YeeE/YedE family protein [Rhodomicrobium sp.]
MQETRAQNPPRLARPAATPSHLEKKHMATFDLVSALIGGALIGTASALLMLLNGRIAGISGILAGVLSISFEDHGWRLAFIAGLIIAPIISGFWDRPLIEPAMPANWLLIIVAGFLTGFGARLGGGCTSGHGVCGLARLSQRSIAATTIFIATAIIVVTIMRHGLGA